LKAVKQTVVPAGNGKGSSDIGPVIYSILLFFLFCCLVLYFYLLLLHFGQKKTIQRFIVALVNVPVKACWWWWLMADERKYDVNMTSRKNTCMMYGRPYRKWKPKWNLLEIFSMKIA